jgi:hypothetical protein
MSELSLNIAAFLSILFATISIPTTFYFIYIYCKYEIKRSIGLFMVLTNSITDSAFSFFQLSVTLYTIYHFEFEK